MKTPKIKICGIKDPDIASLAVKAGADYIGLVFHPDSPRHLDDLNVAKAITKTAHELSAETVAVFVDQDHTEISEICKRTGITIAQLHGNAAKANPQLIDQHIKKIYVIPVNADGSYEINTDHLKQLNPSRDFLLFDYKTPGSGINFDHESFNYAGNFNYFIAGGINPGNVALCAKTLHPFAIDTSSGVEIKKGVKSLDLIQQFIQEARHADSQ